MFQMCGAFAEFKREMIRERVNAAYAGVLQGERYFDIRGILDPTWRNGDSIWSLVPEANLHAVLTEVNQLLQLGHMDEFMRHADRQRHLVGQTTFTIAQRVINL